MNIREIDNKIKSLSNFNKRLKKEIYKMRSWIETAKSNFDSDL